MKKRLLFFLSLLLFSPLIFAQTGQIKGVITDVDNQPVEFASVSVDGGLGTSSNENGKFLLTKVPIGHIKIRIDYLGFETIEVPVTIEENKVSIIEVAIKKSTKELAEVVVTGQKRRTAFSTRHSMELMEIPQTVQIISQDIIQQQGITDMKQVFKNISSANVLWTPNSDADGYVWTTIRGFSINEGFGNYRINGVMFPMRASIFGSYAENVEILKGPASILYGSVAPGAIVNITTKKPLSYDYRNIEMKVGQYGFYRPSIDLSGPLNKDKTLLYRFSASVETGKSFKKISNHRSYNYFGSLKYLIGKKTSVQLDALHSNSTATYDPGVLTPGGTFRELSDIPYNTFLGERNMDYSSTNNFFFLTFEHWLSDTWKLRNLASYNKQEIWTYWPYLSSVDSVGNTRRGMYPGGSQVPGFSNVLDITGTVYTGNIKHEVLLGFDFMHSILNGKFGYNDSIGNINVYAPKYNLAKFDVALENKDTLLTLDNRLGVVFQDKISLFDNKLHLLLAGRYSNQLKGKRHVDKSKQNILKESGEKDEVIDRVFPQLGIVYKANRFASLYFSYSEAFQNNGFDWLNSEIYIEPTLSKQFEIGAKLNFFHDRLGVSVAAFNIDRTNVYGYAYVEEAPEWDYIWYDPAFGQASYSNAHWKSKGIEVDVNGKVNEKLSLIASFAYLEPTIVKDPAFKKGNILEGTPPFSGSIWANYKILKGFDAGAGLFFKDKYYLTSANDPNTRHPSVVTADAQMGYEYKWFRLQINVTNLTNTKYYIPQYTAWQAQMPRRLMGTVSYKF